MFILRRHILYYLGGEVIIRWIHNAIDLFRRLIAKDASPHDLIGVQCVVGKSLPAIHAAGSVRGCWIVGLGITQVRGTNEGVVAIAVVGHINFRLGGIVGCSIDLKESIVGDEGVRIG